MSAKSRFGRKAPRKTITVELGTDDSVTIEVQAMSIRQKNELMAQAGGSDANGEPTDKMAFMGALMSAVCFEPGTDDKVFASGAEFLDSVDGEKLLGPVTAAMGLNAEEVRKNS